MKRVSNRYIVTNFGTYTIYSNNNNRNIAFNSGNILSSNNEDYASEIYDLDNTLSIKYLHLKMMVMETVGILNIQKCQQIQII